VPDYDPAVIFVMIMMHMVWSEFFVFCHMKPFAHDASASSQRVYKSWIKFLAKTGKWLR